MKSMNKLIVYGAALFFSLASCGIALASSPNGDIKGVYNCQLAGGFIAQVSSSGLAQFTVDGTGKVTNSAGELKVVMGAENQPSKATGGVFYLSQYSFQACDYTPSGGSYSISANGTGTLSINWTASVKNTSTPLDCTENITTNYNILVNSPTSFFLDSTDLIGPCGSPKVDYASCGSSFRGTCQQQAAKP